MTVNPYEAATVQLQLERRRASAWRFVPAIFFILLGVTLIVLMIVWITASLSFAASQGIAIPIGKIILTGLVNVLVGIGWIVSAILFLFARYRNAVYTALGAFAVFAIYSLIETNFK
jgi:hypothetical protein